jgi:hypothetical protein
MISGKSFLATASALAVIGSVGLVNAQTSPPKPNAETVQSPQVQSPPPAPDTAQRPGTGSSQSVQSDTRTSPRSGRGTDTMNNSTGPAGTSGSSGNMSSDSNPALAPRAARADRN